jgi:hypothetical protein
VKIDALVCAVLVALTTACAPGVGLVVSAPATVPPAAGPVPDYDRDRFGDGWSDVDQDCQDTRQEILIRDLVDEQLDREGCRVLSGVLHAGYTGTTINFQRGDTTSDDVQIDHILSVPVAAETH